MSLYNHKWVFSPTQRIAIAAIFILLVGSCAEHRNLPDPLEAGWNGEKVCEIMEENDQMRVLKCTFPPGHGHDRHYHRPHWGYAIAGSTFEIKDTAGIRTVVLHTGSDFYSSGVDWHEVRNVGDSTAVYIIVESK